MVRLSLLAQMVLAAAPRYGHCRHQAMLRYENFKTIWSLTAPRARSMICREKISSHAIGLSCSAKVRIACPLVMHTAENHADWWFESCLSAVEFLPCCDPWRTHVASDFSCLAARWRERCCWFSEGQRATAS